MQPRDYLIGIIVGILTAVFWVPVLSFLKLLPEIGNKIWGLVIILPAAYAVGLYIANILSRWKSFFFSFSKFLAIGFLNTGIDFAVFNYLIYRTGIEKGIEITYFKAIAFIVAVINSYLWNKFWTFRAGDTDSRATEFVKYVSITLVGVILNSGVTSGIVNFIPPIGGISQVGWDNVAAAVATVVTLIWNFTGYRIFVFKTK